MDILDDILLEPSGAPVRAGGRFRPKAKPQSSKVASIAVASALPNVITETTVTLSTTVSDTAPSAKSVDVGDGKVADAVGSSFATSETPGNIEPSENNGNLCPIVAFSDGDRSTKPSPATDALQPEVAASDGSGDLHSGFGKAAVENADIFSGLECLDDFLTQNTSGTAVHTSSKSHDKVDMAAQPGDKFFPSYSANSDKEGSVPNSEVGTCPDGNFGAPTHCEINSSAFMVCDVAEAQTYSDFEVLDVVSEATISSGRRGKFQPKLRVKKGKENLHIPHSEVESTTLPEAVHLVSSEIGDMNESSLPAFLSGDVLDHSSPRFGDSIGPNPTSDFQVNAENFAETTHLDGSIFEDAVHSEDAPGTPGKVGSKSRNGKASKASSLPQKCKSSTAGEEAEGGTSSRKLRKRLPRQQVDEPVPEANDDSFSAEPSNDSNFDQDEYSDDEDREHNTSQSKRAPRKSKKPVSENEKPVRKRKRANKAPDESTKEAPKKFSHSTRRNKRQVDKSLLETAEEEIDPQKLPIKDLIRLAEYREQLAIKEATKLRTPQPDQSANNDFHKEASHNEDETFASEQDRSSDENQASYRVDASSSFFNYQSYMDKAPVARWSKQDTENFYEAVRQFGSDFSMIEQFFPGRTRRQLKLKFKKEERQHPLRISEALISRSKDNSQLVSLIERLQKVDKQEPNADESIDVTGKEEVELTHDTDEGVAPPELDEVQDQEANVAEVQDQEADGAEVHNPVKSDENDDDFGWTDDF